MTKEKLLNLKEKIETKTEKEDRLKIFEETGNIIIYPGETSFSTVINNQTFHIGKCRRQTFFDFFNYPETEVKDKKDKEKIETSKLIEGSIIEKFKIIGEVILKESCDKIPNSNILIKDEKNNFKDGTQFVVKAINGGTWRIKNSQEPLEVHIPSIGLNLGLRKGNGEDVQLIIWYKDKISYEDTILELELNNNGKLISDGKEIEGYDFFESIQHLNTLESYILKKEIPPMDYPTITQEQANILFNANKISRKVYDNINNGTEKEFWNCQVCGFKMLCKSSGC